MAAITATDLDTLETAFIAAIGGITPTHQYTRSDGWTHHRGAVGIDDVGGAANRVYYLDWGDEAEADPAEAPFTLSGYTLIAELGIVTAYNVPDERAGRIWNDDHRQVRDVLEDLVDTVAGLLWVKSGGVTVEEDESGHAPEVTHRYEVAYFKART